MFTGLISEGPLEPPAQQPRPTLAALRTLIEPTEIGADSLALAPGLATDGVLSAPAGL